MERHFIKKYETTLVHQLSFYATAIILVVIGYLLSKIPQSLDTGYILTHFNVSLDDFYADGADKLVYFICTLLSVFLYFGAYLLGKHFLKPRALSRVGAETLNLFGIFATGAVAAVSIIRYPQYINLFINSQPNSLTAFVGVAGLSTLLFIFVLGLMKIKNQTGQSIVLGLISVSSMLATAYLYIMPNYHTLDYFSIFHFEAYFYPIYKVISGQTPLVDFNSLYGFYPYFIAPIMNLFTDKGILAFSIVMAALVLLSIAAISYTLFSVLEDKRIALLGSLAVMFTIYIIPILINAGGYYLQYEPHRVIMPAFLIALCTCYGMKRKKSSKDAWYVLGYVFSAIALLWNIDTGMIVLISWIAYHIYISAYERNLNDKRFYFESAKAILAGLASVLLAGAVLLLITYARTGEFINLMKALTAQTLFYKYGFYMLPTPFLHPWLILVLVYGISLTKAIRNLKVLRDGDAEYSSLLSSLFFLLPVIGLGIFSYYNGRSHENVFLAIVWPGVVLLALFCQEYLQRLKNDGWKTRYGSVNLLKFFTTLWILSLFSVTQLVVLGDSGVLVMQKTKPNHPDYLASTISLIQQVREGDEPLELIMFSSASIYERLGEKMTANVPAVVDWFSKEDYMMVLEQLEKSEYKVIMDSYAYDKLMSYESVEFEKVMEENYILILHKDDIYVYDQRD